MKNDPVALALDAGFFKAEMIDVSRVVCDPRFRAQCEVNACGVYGKCWMCPPYVGPIDELIGRVKSYSKGLFYQSVFELEDSFDFEGMQEGGRLQHQRSRALDRMLREAGYSDFLHLSKGGCDLCPTCAVRENQPCRFPGEALSSLEAYGLNVSATAKSTSMKYINGADTVTYFGIVLFRED